MSLVALVLVVLFVVMLTLGTHNAMQAAQLRIWG